MRKKTWQVRLAAFLMAGGGATAACSPDKDLGGACNANPDPCCGKPDGPLGVSGSPRQYDVCKNNATVEGPDSPACDGKNECCGVPDNAQCKNGLPIFDANPCALTPEGTTCDGGTDASDAG